MIPEIPVSLTAKEKLKIVWDHLERRAVEEEQVDSASLLAGSDKRDWPTYNEVLQDIRKSDYNDLLTCPLDLHPGKEKKKPSMLVQKLSRTLSTQSSRASDKSAEDQPFPETVRTKTISAQGVVCTAKLEMFDFPNGMKGKLYSGLLKPGTETEDCLVRLSSVLQPMDMGNNNRVAKMMFGEKLASAKIFPGAAIKFFRTNQNSANALFLGSKVGQVEDEFFAHCLCTQMTSRMPITLKPILQIFKQYSKFPMALGLSDLCTYDVHGEMAEDLNFPFCLTLCPRVRTKVQLGHDSENDETNASKTLDSFLDDVKEIPKGTTLFDVFACPDPLAVADATRLQRIGKIVSTSAMKASPQDDGLFFRHQKKDEDFALRSDWMESINTQVVLKDGSKGTAATLAGWELFEQQIQEGSYTDFEKASK